MDSIIILIALTKLPKINGCMTKWTVFQLIPLNFRLIHFMPACLTTIIVSCGNGLATCHTSREIYPTSPTCCIVLRNRITTVLPRTFHLFCWCIPWGMLSEDTHGNFCELFPLFRSSHSLQLHKCPRAFLITLHLNLITLL
jgi:hypothetical protein